MRYIEAYYFAIKTEMVKRLLLRNRSGIGRKVEGYYAFHRVFLSILVVILSMHYFDYNNLF